MENINKDLSTNFRSKISEKSNKSLLNKYEPGVNLYFSTPKYALLASPPFANLLETHQGDLLQRVSDSLRFAKELGNKNPKVMGAIPFDVNERPSLKLCANCIWEDNSFSQRKYPQLGERYKDLNEKFELNPNPKPEAYKSWVNEALKRFSSSDLEKVVLARTLEIKCEESIDIKGIMNRLESNNEKGFTFAVDLADDILPTYPKLNLLVGASPELLISKRGNKILANPLAGSEPRSSDPQIDIMRSEQLLKSEKDLREHELVIKSIEKALKPFCRKIKIPKKPELTSTSTMWHLSTVIEGELDHESITSLELALAMHPTPAICGYPPKIAKESIYEIENFERGLYTGMVGWCNLKGDGDWAVTIRCAEINDRNIKLYAGAGIVEGSSPTKELDETQAKFNTMLQALGLRK